MTSWELIESIFARVDNSLPSNVRRITRKQHDWLRDLIEAEYPGALKIDGPGRLLWTPRGRHKYVLTEDRVPGRDKHTLEKLSNLVETSSGRLF